MQVRVWTDRGQLDQAVTLGRQVVEFRKALHPEGHWRLGAVQLDLGRALVLQGRHGEAKENLDAALREFTKMPPPLPEYHTAWTECWSGAAFAGMRRFPEAEKRLLAAEEKLRAAPGTPRRHHRQAVEQIVKLYETWSKPAEAAKWRKALAEPGDGSGTSERR